MDKNKAQNIVRDAVRRGKLKKPDNCQECGLKLTPSMVSRFSDRGDEFRKAWNKDYGVDEEKAEGGVVNPAILTINTGD